MMRIGWDLRGRREVKLNIHFDVCVCVCIIRAYLLTPPEVDAEAPRGGGRSGGRDSSGETLRLTGNPNS